MRRYCEWGLLIAVVMVGVRGVNAQESDTPATTNSQTATDQTKPDTQTEPEIVPAPEDLVDKSAETDVDRLSNAGIVDEQMIARLRAMTLTDLLSEARRLIDEETFREAAPYIAVARERDPHNLEVTVMLGELALLQGDIQAAREKLLEAYHANRNDYHAASGLGRLYLMTRRSRQAVNYLEKAEQLAPQDQLAHAQRLLAEAYLGSNSLIKARDMAKSAVDAAPDKYDPRRVYATVLITIKDLDQALVQIQALEQIARDEVAANPGDLQALKRLILAWNVHKQALSENFQELVITGPDGTPTDEVKPGMEEDAANITRSMVKLQLRTAEADHMVKLFQIIEISAQTLRYDPDSSEQWYNHGLLLLETQQYDSAYKAFEKAVELDPDNTAARVHLDQLKAARGVPVDDTPAAADSTAATDTTTPVTPPLQN